MRAQQLKISNFKGLNLSWLMKLLLFNNKNKTSDGFIYIFTLAGENSNAALPYSLIQI